MLSGHKLRVRQLPFICSEKLGTEAHLFRFLQSPCREPTTSAIAVLLANEKAGMSPLVRLKVSLDSLSNSYAVQSGVHDEEEFMFHLEFVNAIN